MRIPVLGIRVDERFLEHRRRSTSIAGVAAALLALVLFEYHYLVDHVWRWELLAVALTFVGVKLTVLGWSLWAR
jgi:hypothetical protein